MKNDLNIPRVTGVEIAAVRQSENDELWDMYIINRNGFAISNILISSRGYGVSNGETQKTSILRHLIEFLDAKSMAKIEPIQKDVFHLTNEYWVSYYHGSEIYDKKYIFLPESIQDKYVSPIKGFGIEGVLHR